MANSSPVQATPQTEKATPRPWMRRGISVLAANYANVLTAECCGRNHDFQLPGFENEANAELIVRAVNRDHLFDAVVEALTRIMAGYGEPVSAEIAGAALAQLSKEAEKTDL